ncbi:MAG: S41 family peptidase [Planctomycetales bacterium]
MFLQNVFQQLIAKRKFLTRALLIACSLGLTFEQGMAQSGYRPIAEGQYPGYQPNSFEQQDDNDNVVPRVAPDRRMPPSTRRGGNNYGGSLLNRNFDEQLGHEPVVVPQDRPRSQEDNFAPRNRYEGAPVQNSPRYRPSDEFQGTPRKPRELPVKVQPSANPIEEVHQRIQRRYRNTSFLSLLNMQPQGSLQLYTEVMNLIDTRHVEPTSIQARLDQGVLNLTEALRDPVFLQTNRLNLQPGQGEQFAQTLRQWGSQARVQNSSQAVSFVGQVAQMAQQQVGLNPTVAVMEFVYGACESLDKYSTFVPPERSPGASLQLEEQVVGIGVQLELGEEGAEIVKVISGSPAAEAGLKKGDKIVSVGEKQVTGLDLDKTVDLIAGPAGVPVQVTIQRGQYQTFPVSIPRRAIQLNSVTDVQMLGNSGVGYFKLEKFANNSSAEVDQALWKLHQQGMKSLILDLRGDPGGLLTTAIEISDKFLPEGVIVSTRGRNASDNTQEVAKYPNTWKIPLVVLIDKNSASASEIFAAAIQENQRGVIVGRTSYGKGTVQTQFPLKTAGCSLRITTARFYSPKGRAMAGSGVTPDFWIDEVNNSNYQEPFDHDVQEALRVATQEAGRGMDLTRTNPRIPNRGY